MMSKSLDESLSISVVKLLRYFQSVRAPCGFTSPIVHIWRSSLVYCGSIIDWRYEGIIEGMINLYHATQDKRWLNEAVNLAFHAAHSLTNAGNYYASSFEYGSFPGGTPHEATVTKTLLMLSYELFTRSDERWKILFKAAKANIEGYLLTLHTGRLFKNLNDNINIVYNKCATIIEALLFYYDMLCCRGSKSKAEMVLGIARSTGESIVRVQRGDGGIPQATLDPNTYTYYTARCIIPLLKLLEYTDDDEFLQCALRAAKFIEKMFILEQGFCQVLFTNGKKSFYPMWIAGMGDILYSLIKVKEMKDVAVNHEIITRGTRIILDRQTELGGVWSAYGFHKAGSSVVYLGPPEFRDILPCIGWMDKAFKFFTYLCRKKKTNLPRFEEVKTENDDRDQVRIECVLKGRCCTYVEDINKIELLDDAKKKVIYKWIKHEPWAYLDLRN